MLEQQSPGTSLVQAVVGLDLAEVVAGSGLGVEWDWVAVELEVVAVWVVEW